MMLNSVHRSQDTSIHASSRHYFWLDLIELEKIPELGTFLLVDLLLKETGKQKAKHIQLAAKLLNTMDLASVIVHVPNVCKPRDFLEKMIHASDAFFTEVSPSLARCARALKQNLEQFELSWNSDMASRFLLSWKNFTHQFLKCKVEALLESV
jgi:hypothetical protein